MLGEAIKAQLESDGANVELLLLDQLEWPLYSAAVEAKGIPDGAIKIANKLLEQQGLIFVAPEYNGGLPPSLTNFIAWISRTGKDWRLCFNGKPAAIATHSGSGGIQALVGMRTQLAYLGMNVLGRQIHTHMKKPVSEETIKSISSQLLALI